MYKVYVLQSENNGNLYIGFTNDLKRRLLEHNKGQNRSTKAYIPYKLLFYEVFETRKEARNREKYLKSGIGRDYIKNKWLRSSTE